ncbi:MAG: hypothetical protein MZV64_63400 [Ignavibacteriales bacterium]|nr:hypothetical protein [Ignavibacteriales bacterium]
MAGAFTSPAKDPSALKHNPAGLAFLDGTRTSAGPPSSSLPARPPSPTTPAPPSTNRSTSSSIRPTSTSPIRSRTGSPSASASPRRTVWASSGPIRRAFPGASWGAEERHGHFQHQPDGRRQAVRALLRRRRRLLRLLEADSGPGPAHAHGRDPPRGPGRGRRRRHGLRLQRRALYRGAGFRIGLSYRSRFTLITRALTLDVPVYETPFEGTGATSFRFPDIMTLGLSFDLTKKLVWAVDFHYFLWSVYDSYTFHIEVPDLALTEDIVVPTLWQDSWTSPGPV